MRTRATFGASTYYEAAEVATKAFNEFFGEHPWVFRAESADAETVVAGDGVSAVAYWSATFEAEATA